MSQRNTRKSLTTTENILYELNDYDRQRKAQDLIEDDHIQSVPIDPILKSLSVKKETFHSFDFCSPLKSLDIVSNMSRFIQSNNGDNDMSTSFLC